MKNRSRPIKTEHKVRAQGNIYKFDNAVKDRGKNPLVLGFAYSLTPDGAPGIYNRILAQTIMTDWDGKKAWIGVQWEIRDAMDEPTLCSNIFKELKSRKETSILRGRLGTAKKSCRLPPTHTAPPCDPIAAKSQGKDTVDCQAFRKRLLDSLDAKGDPAVAVFAATVAALARQVGYTGTNDAAVLRGAIYSPQQIADYLNRLIQTEQNFHRRFWRGKEAMLELHDRQRGDFGPVGFEKRELPASAANLGQYQNQRVNRLIVQAICPDPSILPEPAYLSTKGVLQHLFREMPSRGTGFDRVYIYASPVHSARCKRQFIEFAWSVGWPVDAGQVTVIYFADDMSKCGWIWDEGTAQVWCRSKQAWEAYETNSTRLQ